MGANNARGGDKNLVGLYSKIFRYQLGCSAGVLKAHFAGAGIGVSGVDDNGSHLTILNVFLAQNNGCGLDLIGGKDARRDNLLFGINQGQILFSFLFEPGSYRRSLETIYLVIRHESPISKS